MPRHPSCLAPGVLAVALAASVSPATAGGPRRPDGPMEAFRRGAEAEAQKKAAVFDELRKIPAPIAPVRVGAPAIVVPEFPPPREFRPPAPQAARAAIRAVTFDEEAEGEEAENGAIGPAVARVLARENVDLVIFGDDGGDDEVRRGRLGELLAQKIDRADRFNRLSPAQRSRLRLAGQGDLKRFFDRVGDRRREFDEVRDDLRAGVAFLRGLYGEQVDYRDGPFGAGSLYDKALKKILRDVPGRPVPIPTILDR